MILMGFISAQAAQQSRDLHLSRQVVLSHAGAGGSNKDARQRSKVWLLTLARFIALHQLFVVQDVCEVTLLSLCNKPTGERRNRHGGGHVRRRSPCQNGADVGDEPLGRVEAQDSDAMETLQSQLQRDREFERLSAPHGKLMK